MRTTQGAGEVIQTMKALGKLKTDSGLADFLGVSKVTIASWRKRGSVPIDKCLFFAQKTMTDIETILFGCAGYANKIRSDNMFAIGVALHFINRARECFLYGDEWQTSLWWGRKFPYLISYYETTVFAVSENDGLSFDDAAINVMKAIDVLEPADMIELLEKQTDPKGIAPQ